MDSAHQPPTGHASSNSDQEAQVPLGGLNRGETWAFGDSVAAEGAGSSSTPYVSLFSPSVPAIPPSTPAAFASGSARVHAGPYRSLSSSRSMPSLANDPSMTMRTARLQISDDRPPIVQLQTRIDRAQKSADDPNTPLETEGKRRTTMDLMRSENSVRTDLSRLFSESANMPGSRAPSYNNATGPLYLRGIYIWLLTSTYNC
jgi:hypothetical protein